MSRWILHVEVPYPDDGSCNGSCDGLSLDCKLVIKLERVMTSDERFAGTFKSCDAGRDERTFQWRFGDERAAQDASGALVAFSGMQDIRTAVQEPGKRFPGWDDHD